MSILALLRNNRVIWNGGLDTEKGYKYHGMMNLFRWCNKKKEKGDKAVGVSSFTSVKVNDSVALMQAVAERPISIGIMATATLQYYKGGVLPSKTCGDKPMINHGVLLVGYGVDKDTNKPYWLIKNSWGSQWGEEGYFKMERIMTPGPGSCGITLQAAYPTIGATHETPDTPPPKLR